MEEVTSELDNEEVDNNNDNPDQDESRVFKEAVAKVDFVMDLSGGNHVDNLKPDEQVEDEGHVTGGVTISTTCCFICVLNTLVKLVTVDLIKSTREDHIVFNNIQLLSPGGEAECLVRLRDHVLTTEEEDEKNDHLVDRHPENVLGHLARNDKVVLVLRRAIKKGVLGEISSKSERCK